MKNKDKVTTDLKSDCSKHKKDLFGETDMKVVAKAIRNMHHEARAILIDELANEISLEGWEDQKLKPELSEQLFTVAGYLTKAAIHSNFVWQISKPYMENKKPNQP